MKYIVKNCPCYCEGTVIRGNGQLTQTCQSLHRVIKEGKTGLEKCCNISDCIIKQIVDKCKFEKGKGFTMSRYGCKVPKSEAWDLASEIIELLEIEEVNE